MLRLVLGSPAGGLGIYGSDGRSVPVVGPRCLTSIRDSDKSEQTNSVRVFGLFELFTIHSLWATSVVHCYLAVTMRMVMSHYR